MVGNTYLSNSHIDIDNEYSLLTKEKIDEISDRISNDVSRLILKQLEELIQYNEKKDEKSTI